MLQDHYPTSLTPGQHQAVADIETFLTSSAQCFILKGYAGTGKTFLVAGLVRYLKEQRREVHLLAPTGRAAMILADKSGVEAKTIHRHIFNLNEVIDDDDSYRLRYGLRPCGASANAIYVVDESSMVGDHAQEDEFFVFGSGRLLKDLFEHAAPLSSGRKMIFIGDGAQLPPVNAIVSPALDPEYLQRAHGLTCQQFELTDVVRQAAGSGILELATSLREALRTSNISRFVPPKDHTDVIESSEPEIVADFIGNWQTVGRVEAVIVTHSNRQAFRSNEKIRDRLFPGQRELQPSDWLLVIRNSYNHAVDLYNGQFIRVLDRATECEVRTIRFRLRGGKTATADLRFRNVTVECRGADQRSHELSLKLIENALDSDQARLSGLEQQALYVDFKQRHPDLKPKTEAFKDAIKHDHYFNALQVKYGYAITCHKAQGGEWQRVYLDLRAYMPILSRTFFRWCYTGVTRAAARLYLIGAQVKTPISDITYHPVKTITKPWLGQYPSPVTSDVASERGFPNPFQQQRYAEVMEKAKEYGVTVEVQLLDYRDRYRFTQDGKWSEWDMVYGKSGYTSMGTVRNGSDPTLATLVKTIMTSQADRPFTYSASHVAQGELYSFLKEVLQECDSRITNIVSPALYHDRIFMATDADCAGIDFYYDADHRYTVAIPFSMLGAGDLRLEQILSALR